MHPTMYGASTGGGLRCYPLTLMDAFSRFLLRCEGLLDPDGKHVRHLDSAFLEFGLPAAIRSDGGPPFASTGPARLTELSVWLLKLGSASRSSRPASRSRTAASSVSIARSRRRLRRLRLRTSQRNSGCLTRGDASTTRNALMNPSGNVRRLVSTCPPAVRIRAGWSSNRLIRSAKSHASTSRDSSRGIARRCSSAARSTTSASSLRPTTRDTGTSTGGTSQLDPRRASPRSRPGHSTSAARNEARVRDVADLSAATVVARSRFRQIARPRGDSCGQPRSRSPRHRIPRLPTRLTALTLERTLLPDEIFDFENTERVRCQAPRSAAPEKNRSENGACARGVKPVGGRQGR